MVACSTCGAGCNGVCDSKVKELAGIVGDIGKDGLRRLLEGADGDVNRAVNHFFDSGSAPSVPLPPPTPREERSLSVGDGEDGDDEDDDEEDSRPPTIHPDPDSDSTSDGLDEERLIQQLLEEARQYSHMSSSSVPVPLTIDDDDEDSDDSDDDVSIMSIYHGRRNGRFHMKRRTYWNDSDDDSDSDSGPRGGRSSPVEVLAAPKGPINAGSITIDVEKDEHSKLYDFLAKLHSTKPVEYDYVWTSGAADYQEAYEKKVADFKKGKLDNNLPLVKLNRNISEVFSEVVDGIKFGELVSYLTRYVTKRRISVETECHKEKDVFELIFKVNFLPSFFTAKRNSAFAKTLFDLLKHDVTTKPTTPVSISAAKPVGDGITGHYIANTAELYKYMESDGYPISITPAMTTDLRVDLREYQKQVVSWMADRENLDMGMCDAFWETRKLPNGDPYYYCPIASRISLKPPAKVKGGILCEEMGLGKTVEVIALILANSPFKKQPNFFQRNNTTTSTTSSTTTTTTTTSTSSSSSSSTPIHSTNSQNGTDDDETQLTKKRRTRGGKPTKTKSPPHPTSTTTTTTSTKQKSPDKAPSPNREVPDTSGIATPPLNSPTQEGSLRRSRRQKRDISYSDLAEDTEMAEEEYKEDTNDIVSEEDEETIFKEIAKPKKSSRSSKKRKKDETEEDDALGVDQQAREKEIEREIEQERQRQKEREKQKEKEKQEKEKDEKAKAETEAAEKGKEPQQEELSQFLKISGKRGKEPIVPYPVDDLVHSKATLIVCPVSLLRQWETELRTKVRPGTLRVLQYHGPKRLKDVIQIAKGYDVVLTSYSILTTDRTVQKGTGEGLASPWGTLERIHWHRIVLDEAHYIKSPTSLTSRICRVLAGSIKWAVTGTPIQNQISDIVGLFDFLNLEPFRTKYSFTNLDTHQLLQILRHLVMRHTKEQKVGGKPIVTLPPRTERVVYSEMTEDERTLYSHLYSICSVKFNALANQNAISSHYTYVMSSLILPLRQICAHVSLVSPERFIDDTGGGAKRQREGPQAQALTEDVDLKPALEKMRKGDRTEITAILSKSGHPECPICLEVSDLPTVTPCFHLFCNGCIREIAQQGRGVCPLCRTPFAEGDLVDVFPSTSSSSSSDPLTVADIDPEIAALLTKLQTVHSSKTSKLMEELKAIIRKDRTAKVVIFTQWTPFFKKLETQLHQEGIKFAKLTGEMSMIQKGNALSKFQSDPSICVFLLSLRSGAVGLTLTAANHLFLLDPSFNKGTEMQAINRIYRIGQTRETTITHMVVKNSIEEKIYKRNQTIHTTEQDTIPTLGQKENASTTELMTLFA